VPFADWEKVNRNGFGNADYSHTSSMIELDGELFISGFKWEGWLTDAEVAESVVPGTAADSVVAKTRDGLTWDIITKIGFMEQPMAGVMWMEAYHGKVFLGGHARNGPMQLWVYEPVKK
jgi:hypothetical protein